MTPGETEIPLGFSLPELDTGCQEGPFSIMLEGQCWPWQRPLNDRHRQLQKAGAWDIFKSFGNSHCERFE